MRDRGEGEIARAMQLIAGRTAQEFNQRKARKGAFWEDRYHATAVDSGEYLARCMAYIDLNMARAGVVQHPGEWPVGGYAEIQNPPLRYSVIDYRALLDVLGLSDIDQLQRACRAWVDEGLRSTQQIRDGVWTESLAVGRPEFVEAIRTGLGVRAHSREVVAAPGAYVLREPAVDYTPHFGRQMACLSGDNTVLLT